MDSRGLVHNLARIAFAVLGAVAMTYQFAKLNGNASFSPGNFFSFFTIQWNIFAAAMLVLTALIRRDERSRLFDALRGAVTFYIAARAAEATFNMLRDMPDAPATFVSVDVCEVIAHT